MLVRRLFQSISSYSLRLLTAQCSTSSANKAKTVDELEFEDFQEVIDEVQQRTRDENESFAKLLRHSKFMQLGDFDGRLVVGKVVHRVGDDLYIDFGLKFNAVCKAPPNSGYTLGSKVLLRLHDPELSEKFLGSKHDLTLLEADATLIKLIGASAHKTKEQQKESKTAANSESPA